MQPGGVTRVAAGRERVGHSRERNGPPEGLSTMCRCSGPGGGGPIGLNAGLLRPSEIDRTEVPVLASDTNPKRQRGRYVLADASGWCRFGRSGARHEVPPDWHVHVHPEVPEAERAEPVMRSRPIGTASANIVGGGMTCCGLIGRQSTAGIPPFFCFHSTPLYPLQIPLPIGRFSLPNRNLSRLRAEIRSKPMTLVCPCRKTAGRSRPDLRSTHNKLRRHTA